MSFSDEIPGCWGNHLTISASHFEDHPKSRISYVVETIVKPWFQHVSTTEQMFIPYSTEITLATAAGAAAVAGA